MSGPAPSVSAAQAIARWQAERSSPRDLRPAPDATGGTAVAATVAAARGTLMEALVWDPVGAAAAAEESPGTEIGGAARLVSRLLGNSSGGRPITPLLPLSETPGHAAGIAAGLRETVRASGLFYESHLADWVAGTGGKAALLHEPQVALPAWNAQAAETLAGSGQLAPQAEALVQRQLEVLENNEALWRGQLWPGQDAELRIAQETRHDSPAGEREWMATLRLSFPGLGAIEARIGLHGNSATVGLRAEDPDTTRTLNARCSEYARALDAQGLNLSRASVSHDAQP